MEKIYLTSLAEITKALSEGKKVIRECKNRKYVTYKLLNGILVALYADRTEVISDCITINDGYSNFYIGEDSFSIEVGKLYKTRGGKKALCLYIDNCRKGDSHTYKMYCIGQANHYWVDSKGNKDSGFYSDLDIVDYWEGAE